MTSENMKARFVSHQEKHNTMKSRELQICCIFTFVLPVLLKPDSLCVFPVIKYFFPIFFPS